MLNSRGWAVDVDVSLVNAHFKAVPSVGTVSTWGSSCSDGKFLGWNTDWSFDDESAILGSLDDVTANRLESLNISSTNSHSALVGLLLDLNVLGLVFLSVHHFQISEATSLINNKPNVCKPISLQASIY